MDALLLVVFGIVFVLHFEHEDPVPRHLLLLLVLLDGVIDHLKERMEEEHQHRDTNEARGVRRVRHVGEPRAAAAAAAVPAQEVT